MMSKSLKQDYAYCENIIKTSSKSFYTAFSKLPKAKAKAVYAIYAFCRQADDTVDTQEPLKQKKENLGKLEQDLQKFVQGETPDHPMWRALKDVFSRYEMDANPFFEQIEGQKQDLNFKAIKDLKALKQYSYYVAGSVGLMLLPILSKENGVNQEIKESALSLGIAMQLTNILRDIGEDYKDNNRIHLPADLIHYYDVNLEKNMTSGPDSAFMELWEAIAAEAEEDYQQFFKKIHLYDEDCRFPVLVSAKLYRAILESVRKNNYDCLQSRNFVPQKRMLELVLAAKKALK